MSIKKIREFSSNRMASLEQNHYQEAIETAPINETDSDNQKVDLAIKGMTCAACVRRVETALTHVPGVITATVNLSTERASVGYVSGATDFSDLIDAIRDAGYDAETIRDEKSEDWERLNREQRYRQLFRKLTFSAIFTVLIIIGSFAEMFPFLKIAHEQILWLILFGLTTPVLFYPGLQFYIGAWKALKHRTADMNTLIAIGPGAA